MSSKKKKKQCKVCCSRCANSTQQQHLLNSFLECNPSLLWQQQRLANGHTETQLSVTKSLLCIQTHQADWSLDSPSSWQVKEEISEPSFSIRRWTQFEMTSLYTEKWGKKVFKKGKLWVIFIFFQSTSYSYRFYPMDYIPFVPLSFKTILMWMFLNS